MIALLTIDDIKTVAHALAEATMSWSEPIPPFRTRYPERLESCLATMSQTFDGKPLYPGVINHAAILFYLMVKNHPFQNGNKRIAVTALLVFLFQNGKWLKTDEQGLYNFAVWVAESPSELKDETVHAVVKFFEKNIIEA
jgi:death-on-curing family protein